MPKLLEDWINQISASTTPSQADLTSSKYVSWITSTTGRGGVHRTRPGEPAPVRGDPRLLRRRADLSAGRGPLRLHPMGADRPGPPVQGREAGTVRPTPQTRPASGPVQRGALDGQPGGDLVAGQALAA